MDIHYNLGNTEFHSSDIIEEKPKEKNEVMKMIEEKKITTFGELRKFMDNVYSRQSITDF